MRGRSAAGDDAAPDAAIPPERRVGTLADAFRRALRSSLIIANIGAGIVAFGALVIGSQRDSKVPLVALIPVTAVVFGLVACALLTVLVRGPLRDALETFAWAGRSASLRWRDVAGRRPPGTPAAARAWLDTAPALDSTWAPLRAEAALFAGDLAEANRSIDGCPVVTPGQRFGREVKKSL